MPKVVSGWTYPVRMPPMLEWLTALTFGLLGGLFLMAKTD